MNNKQKKELDKIIKTCLPEAKNAVMEAVTSNSPIILHQDAFAADYLMSNDPMYNEREFFLLSMFIKYAGEYGVELRIIGKNRETLK